MTDTAPDLPTTFREALAGYRAMGRPGLAADPGALATWVDEHGDQLMTVLAAAAEAIHHPHGSPGLEGALDTLSVALERTTDPLAKVHLALGLDREHEQPWITECSPGDYDDDPTLFEADVPAVLWDDLERCWRTASAIQERIFTHAEIDITTGEPVEVCSEWVGPEGRPGVTRWYVALPASGDENVWPAGGRPVHISHAFDTEQEAVSALEGLPAEIYLVPGYLPPWLTPIAKERLFVRRDDWPATGPGECHRCGRAPHLHHTKVG